MSLSYYYYQFLLVRDQKDHTKGLKPAIGALPNPQGILIKKCGVTMEQKIPLSLMGIKPLASQIHVRWPKASLHMVVGIFYLI